MQNKTYNLDQLVSIKYFPKELNEEFIYIPEHTSGWLWWKKVVPSSFRQRYIFEEYYLYSLEEMIEKKLYNRR